MQGGVLDMLPIARAGHIGMYRDSFIQATVEYYFKIPDDSKGKRILLVDPMLATAGTAVAAISRLKQYEVGEIRFCCIVASPEGVREMQERHPDVAIYCLSIDRCLNEKNYIMPGLGDAGDRLYGTKGYV
jgi:uracil phosphoribosyltransferase